MKGSMDRMMGEMHKVKMTGNIDVDFALMMKAHHQGAVEMAEVVLQSGQDPKIKEMAEKISDAQRSEIKELNKFIEKHQSDERNYDPAKKEEGFAKSMEESMKVMMNMPEMDEHVAASRDHQFVHMMIPHHQSAVDMATGYLKYGKDSKLLAIAREIIADQNTEIEKFKNWTNQQKMER
jgi:uncharacterized protein (DUF305 family)